MAHCIFTNHYHEIDVTFGEFLLIFWCCAKTQFLNILMISYTGSARVACETGSVPLIN